MARKKTSKHNKDYIINLRVSRDTYENIKTKAKENKETISGMLRKLLDDTGDIISDVSDDILGKERYKEHIVAYHKAVLAKDVTCRSCETKLKKGTSVTVGETLGAKKYYFCVKCSA